MDKHGQQQQHIHAQRNAGEHAKQHVVHAHEGIAMATMPQTTLLMPRSMLSAPRLGPMVNSSMISMGAASEPARSSSAVSLASAVVMRPEICTRPPPISERITGRRHHLALALFKQHDGHALADVLARDVA
jgi:hypothetical protein